MARNRLRQRRPLPSLTIGLTVSGTVIKLSVLGEFRLQLDDGDQECSAGSQRLLGMLAIRGCPIQRRNAAVALWPDHPAKRAMGNVRAAIWGARHTSSETISCEGHLISLGSGVVVDLHNALDEARRALTGSQPDTLELGLLGNDLLESWDDEWVLVERERFRQLRLHALEAACRRLAQLGNFCEAIDAGLLAVSADPFRESAHRALIEAHLAEGNRFDAGRQYRTYAGLMDELGVEPSSLIENLVGAATTGNGDHRQGDAAPADCLMASSARLNGGGR
jgi:DNA-binding SARP family transcriptional activator